MGDFSVETVGDTPGDIEKRLETASLQTSNKVNDALMNTAVEVEDDLEETSPVDTGEYEDSWYIYSVKEDEVWILNEADHAQHVMLPNSIMVGSPKADLPTSGVLHNAEGVARSHSSDLSSNLKQELEELFEELGV